MITITCDRCAGKIYNDRMNNEVALAKLARNGEGEERIVKFHTRYDLCDDCLKVLEGAIADTVRPRSKSNLITAGTADFLAERISKTSMQYTEGAIMANELLSVVLVALNEKGVI